jgi:hypothetical protein
MVMIGGPERGNYGDVRAISLNRVPIPHREAVHGTTVSFSYQHQLHTWIGGGLQANRHAAATGDGKGGFLLKLGLTVRSYCDKQGLEGWGFVEIPHKP